MLRNVTKIPLENLKNLEILQTDYDRQYDYIAQGEMIIKITSKLV